MESCDGVSINSASGSYVFMWSIATFTRIKHNTLHSDILSSHGNATNAAEMYGEKRIKQERYRQKDRMVWTES